MADLFENSLVKTFTTRLPVSLFQHIKAQDNPSDFIRKLVEKDMVQYEES